MYDFSQSFLNNENSFISCDKSGLSDPQNPSRSYHFLLVIAVAANLLLLVPCLSVLVDCGVESSVRMYWGLPLEPGCPEAVESTHSTPCFWESVPRVGGWELKILED
jgi:hypothetical protein